MPIHDGLMAARRIRLLIIIMMSCLVVHGVAVPSAVLASADIPIGHWAYEAIERLTALGVIDRALVIQKPYSRKQAAAYVAQAIDGIRADRITVDGREAVAEPILDRLMRELRPELIRSGTLKAASMAR